MTYNAYIKMGYSAHLTPQLISSNDFIFIYKSIIRDKSELTFADFKEILVKIATVAKFKLGGVKGTEEEVKAKEAAAE